MWKGPSQIAEMLLNEHLSNVIWCKEDKKNQAKGKTELTLIALNLAVYVVVMALNMKSFVFGCLAVSAGTELPMG
jgi:hypothetical protein